MSCTCRVDKTSHPYGNTVATEEIVTQCESCRRADLLEMVIKNEWAIRTLSRHGEALRLFIDKSYDVDNHRAQNEKEFPFSGAGECMEALELLWEADL